MARKYSKREFISLCAAGCGAVALGAAGLRALGRTAVGGGAALIPVSPAPVWKWSKEAYYYHMDKGDACCDLCPNACVVGPGEKGHCRSRINEKGKYYSISYGNPCSVHDDPVEKKPLYHFLPRTRAYSIAAAGCTFRCLNCQNWEISQVGPEETRNVDLFPSKVVSECIDSRCESIAYTYSEPMSFYEYMFDTAKLARANRIHNLLISNGYIKEKPLRALSKYIDAANINLKSFSEEIYGRLNGGSLAPVLNTLKVLKEEGVWLEITNLVVPTWTDDFTMIRRMCDWLVINNLDHNPLHFLRFFPLYKLTQLPSTPVSTLEKARNIALSAGMKFVYIGNVPGTGENTICPKCKKILVERRGFTTAAMNIVKGNCKFCKEPIPGVWI